MFPHPPSPHQSAGPIHLIIAFYYLLAAGGLDKFAVSLGLAACYVMLVVVDGMPHK